MRGRTEGTQRHWFKKGNAGGGRPAGSTSLKTFARDFLMSLSEEDKVLYLSSVPAIDVWRMAEGNPHSTSDETVKHIIPTPIIDVVKVDKPLSTSGDSPALESGT